MMGLDSFELYLERSGKKKATIYSHVNTIRRLNRDYPDCFNNLQTIDSTLLDLKHRGFKNVSLNRYIASIKVYVKFIERPDLYSIKNFREEPSFKATLSDEELESILALPRIKKIPVGIWDTMTMFYAILCFTGARPGEVAKLSVDTVDFGQKVFIFLDTKTHENRIVPIHPILMEKYHLTEYVKQAKEYLFPSSRGGMNREGYPVISSAEWTRNFNQRLEALGIKRKGVSTYSCRHSWITRMIAADVNLFKIQKIVGHKKIETTAVYTHLTSGHDQQTVQSDPLGLRSVDPSRALKRMVELIGPLVERDSRFSWSFSDDEIVIKIKP